MLQKRATSACRTKLGYQVISDFRARLFKASLA